MTESNDASSLFPAFVGVRFASGGKSYYFGTNTMDLQIGDAVVVATAAGEEIGTVSTLPRSTAAYTSSLLLKPVLRRPTPDDQADYELGLKEAAFAMDITRKEVASLGLPMRLLDASYTLDGSKVTITYTADNRVDFRELLRILAPQLKCRIELHQLPPREKAKQIGGMGICGLTLCCSTFLNQFDNISISRAKNQMLTLNIPKLSGQCGKLLCCLLYEDDVYTEAKKEFPRLGSVVHNGGVDYKVEGFNILTRAVKLVSLMETKFVSLEDYNALAAKSVNPVDASAKVA